MKRFIILSIVYCVIICQDVDELKKKIGDSLRSKMNQTQFDQVKNQPLSKLGILNSFLDAYNEIKTAFKTTFHTKIVKEFRNRGFESLNIKTDIIEKVQYDEDNLADFLELLINVVNVPESKKDEFLFSVVDFPSTKTVWTGHEMFFQSGESDNKMNYVQVFINQDLEKPGTINIMTVDVRGEFGLASDLIIKQKSSSYVGGIFNKEEIIYENRPANLEKDDLEGLFTFFKYIATNAYLAENGLEQQ